MAESATLLGAWCDRYFGSFLPGLVNQLLVPELSGLTTCFEIHVTDVPQMPWRLVIEEGKLVYVGHEGEEPVCRYSLDSDTLRRVAGAEETPQEAFFDLRVALEGDMEMGLKLSVVLEPFFARFPFRG